MSSSSCSIRAVNPTSNTSGKYSTSRSEEHTSELQSQSNLVCRLLLEKKNVTDISPGNVTTPAGTVTFTPGGTCTLVSGSCSVSLTPTTAGTVNVSATYGGYATHGPSV